MAWAALAVSVLAIIIAGLSYRHTKIHDAEILALQRQRDLRETRAMWQIQAAGQSSWSMDTPSGPIRELVAEVFNGGGVDSALVVVHAEIGGAPVGHSSAASVHAKSHQAFNVPVDPPQPLDGGLTLRLVDSRGDELAVDHRWLSSP